ncbi:hypothetical protein HU200_060558 [Digitaria exilis]|uniref:Uncharacterized protein n=1 Tax=Digitaria exilis TaxID=1010633 RepID=A0A835A6B8_9POAL|nr:hypothetical protein HU200_060558 [Digitaria exilis]
MRPVQKYKRNYWRFTWTNRTTNGAPVLTRNRNTPKDECSYYSVIGALESNMRLQRGFVGNLSIKYLKQKHAKVVHANVEMMKFGRIEQLLKISKEIGVPSEHIYNLILQRQRPVCPMHKISGYKKYDVSVPMHIRAALERHLKRGPMIAVFWISVNYDDCMKNGVVYRFLDLHPKRDKKNDISNEDRISHAVCVVNFGMEEDVPFLLFRLDIAGWPEFGRVEMQTVTELYGINM